MNHPEETLRPLFAFLGERFDPQVLAFHRVSRNVDGSEEWSAEAVRRPLFASSCGRWRRSLNAQEHAAVLLEPFAALFPTARFIFMTRDSSDVVRSLLRCDWRDPRDGKLLPYTQDPAAATRFSSDFMSLAMQNKPALEAAGRRITLPYEEVCTEPDRSMARLGAFLHEAAPEPRVLPDSARLVTRSQDNPHPPLRDGGVDAASIIS